MSPSNADAVIDPKGQAARAKKNGQTAGVRAGAAPAADMGAPPAPRAGWARAPVAPATPGGSSLVRKQRPEQSSPDAGESSSAINTPAAKKQKTATTKSGLATPTLNAQVGASRGSSSIPSLLAASTPSPRPRGRPPGSGNRNTAGRTPARAPIARAPAEFLPKVKVEEKKIVKPVQPWTAPVDETRTVYSNESELLQNGFYSDAKIICLKKTFKVHRAVLCTRSKWFFDALNGDSEAGQTGVLNLHSHEQEDVETLLKYIYAGKIDLDKYGVDKCNFVAYVRLFKLGEAFNCKALSEDALTYLGQYCDKKLVDLCSYNIDQSGRAGVVDDVRGNPFGFIDDLLKAIKLSYDGTDHETSLQSLFAAFVWVSRDRMFQCREEFLEFANECPRFGNDIFKLALGKNPAKWFPTPGTARTMCITLDHSRKTQHPDRCESCDEVFDEAKVRKALYNPFNVAVRASAWCAPCVEGHKGDAPLWRAAPEKDDEE